MPTSVQSEHLPASGDAVTVQKETITEEPHKQLAPKTDERHVSFEEETPAPLTLLKKEPRRPQNARERWFWAVDKIIAQYNVSIDLKTFCSFTLININCIHFKSNFL